MRLLPIVITALAFAACNSAQRTNSNTTTSNTMETTTSTETGGSRAPNNIHRFQLASIDGSTINFGDYRGKKILVVNTASECGYTRQYEGLEKLYQAHKDKLVVVGVPANNFGGQEPGTNEEIASFCKKNYGVTFPLTAKVDVVGENRHELFTWLTEKRHNEVLDATIKWNFNKFLLDEKGNLLAYFPSKTEPQSEEILAYLK
ncbi:glutathione peroxidase [Aridibaculum aurantiacum]|uniref:glutathione peroxidase n=1 Tax=Aridibaculum aurantiacum TaxID=2810307 RepID=UPI001F615849|nr:glutathione peroxidase [Aridibaculum aurantiacum]